ncbi:MAG: DUF3105 domain-containing protein [Acidimicrobiales bacterium]
MASGKGSKGSKGKKRPPARRPPGARPQATPGAAGSATRAGSAGAPTSTTDAGPAGAEQSPAKTKTTRAERLEAARRARKRKAALTRAGIAGAVALLVLVVAVVVVSNKKEAKANQDRLTAGSCTFDTKSDPTDPAPNNHVPPVAYKVNPPAGGNHSPQAAPAVDYSGGQQVPGDPEIVHAQEHGYVIIWHRPDLTEPELAAVRAPFDRYPADVLVVPRASLTGKAVATAWGRRLLCTEVEAARLTEFVKLYRNEGPEKVPHT